MQETKFIELWNGTVKECLASSFILRERDGEKTINFSDVCSFQKDSAKRIYQNYENIKSRVKELYFKDKTKKISKYKRAAVLIYAVIAGKDPLEYKVKKSEYDKMFLKQRFAFSLALFSLIQGYKINTNELDKPIFEFNKLGVPEDKDDDDFLMSVYKDIYYSEHYKNFNVLTMANVFGLLVERASTLSNFKLLKSK